MELNKRNWYAKLSVSDATTLFNTVWWPLVEFDTDKRPSVSKKDILRHPRRIHTHVDILAILLVDIQSKDFDREKETVDWQREKDDERRIYSLRHDDGVGYVYWRAKYRHDQAIEHLLATKEMDPTHRAR